MSLKEFEGHWTGKFYIRAGLASQGGTLEIEVAADGSFGGKAVDNGVPEVVKGRFQDSDVPVYPYQIHIYGPTYPGYAQFASDGSLKLEGGGAEVGELTATLTRPTQAPE